MSSTNRRRLKKLAREYVRPGVHVSDLHEALTRVQQQRVLWQRYVAAGVNPEVPTGIADVQVLFSNVVEDLARLDEPLGRTSREQQLANLPIDQLVPTIAELAAESDVLHNLQERTELMQTLRDLQLEPLLTDLANRHVPDVQVPAEPRASPGGSPRSRPCSSPTGHCSARTPTCSTGSRPTSDSSTTRTPPASPRGWRGSSPRTGRSGSSTGRRSPPR